VAAAAPTATAPTEVAAAEVATTLVDGVKDRFATKDVGNRTTRTKDMARGREAQTNADELLGISSLRTMTLDHAVSKAPMLASTLGVMTLQTATPSVVHPDAGATTPGFAIDTGATAVTQSTSGGASGGIMNEPLRMPEPKLDFATRAEMFADQVAQRVLGQIRNQAYDVSLQIDPRNLGPMDISLRVDGAKVTANVAVTHPEVRGLLESGLPRLRESLESAGLSLTNWSFAQSGSRDSSSMRQGGGSAAGEMRRVSRVTDEAESGVAVNAIAGGSNRAVDLFV
jgi:flagellar hook-length control protein FliK